MKVIDDREELLAMKLHDIAQLSNNNFVYVLRVIDGWIYNYADSSVFVPEPPKHYSEKKKNGLLL